MQRGEPFVFIDVDDTGPGIPVAERERVMQRFYRILGTQAEGSQRLLRIRSHECQRGPQERVRYVRDMSMMSNLNRSGGSDETGSGIMCAQV